MKASVRGILLIVMATLLTGCGRQDRYEIAAPGPSGVAEPADWAACTSVVVPAFSDHEPGALAGWSPDDFLVAFWRGRTCRVREGLYQPLQWPGTSTVAGMVIRSDDSAWAVDWDGQICTLQGRSWNLVVSLADGNGFQGLLEDDQGRLVAYGQGGRLWREEESGWVFRGADAETDFTDAWAAPGQGTYLVTRRTEVFRLEEEGLQLMTRLEEDQQYYRPRMEGNGTGKLAVSPDRNSLWLLEEEDWVPVPVSGGCGELFWQDGFLYAQSFSPPVLMRLDGGDQWTEICGFDSTSFFDSFVSAPVPGGRLLGLKDAMIELFAGNQVAPVAPALGDLSSILDYEGGTHVLLSSGTHLGSAGEDWEVLGTPLAGHQAYGQVSLQISADGLLLLPGRDRISCWNGQDHEQFDFPGLEWESSFPQSDGGLCLVGSDCWGEFSQGVYTPLEGFPAEWSAIRGMVLAGNRTGWVADRYRLARLGSGGPETRLIVQGWWIRGLVPDPVHSAVAFGFGRVLYPLDTGFGNITPWLQGGLDSSAAWISTLLPDGQGGLVAWEGERQYLLHHDGGTWTYQTNPGFSTRYYKMGLTANADGSFYLFQKGGRNEVFRVRPGESP